MSEREKYFQDFSGFARDLRLWLVAYGIGAPVLFVSQPAIYGKILKSGCGTLIVYLFLAGVGLQILESGLNKWMSWVQYSIKTDGRHKKLSGKADWWFDNIWPRLCCDTLTVFAFLVATFWAIGILAKE